MWIGSCDLLDVSGLFASELRVSFRALLWRYHMTIVRQWEKEQLRADVTFHSLK